MLKDIEFDKSQKLSHSEDFLRLCESHEGRVQHLKACDLPQLMNDASAVVIDVRDKEELQHQGYIPGVYHLSRGWLEAQIHNVAKTKSTKIVLYCGSGKRSVLAAANLQQMGYSDVFSLQGGFKGWKAAGLPVHREQ